MARPITKAQVILWLSVILIFVISPVALFGRDPGLYGGDMGDLLGPGDPEGGDRYIGDEPFQDLGGLDGARAIGSDRSGEPELAPLVGLGLSRSSIRVLVLQGRFMEIIDHRESVKVFPILLTR